MTPQPPRRAARIVVVGNEKGGSGKSTTAMHLAVALLRQGLRVGTIDLDARQGTLSRYVENRREYRERRGIDLPLPLHRRLGSERPVDTAEGTAWLDACLAEMASETDIAIVDAPGTDNAISRYGHSFADILLTPMNDSFIDLDVLAKIDSDTLAVRGPSLYSAMVWEQRKARLRRDGGSIDWVVMRNRLGSLDARNKRAIAEVLEKLSRRVGFRLAPGFGERVIFREMFLTGLTLLDLRETGAKTDFSLSHVAAREEVRALLAALGLGS